MREGMARRRASVFARASAGEGGCRSGTERGGGKCHVLRGQSVQTAGVKQMKILTLGGYALGGFLGAAALAGCNGTPSFSSPTSFEKQRSSSAATSLPARHASTTEQVLYRFQGAPDGGNPEPLLIYSKGTLYGTTFDGGFAGGQCSYVNPGCGTIFSLDSTGSNYSVLYRFPITGQAGVYPIFGVIDVKGILYGTTISGGSGCGSCGTVFDVRTSGKHYHVLYYFKGGGDGAEGLDLTYASGVLFGVTYNGGHASCGESVSGCGTVFQASATSGSESVLHTFKGGSDGNYPANVIDVKGELYGTTTAGGDTLCSGSSGVGCGVVFRMTSSGKKYRVLYAFMGGTDGNSPNALIDVKGTLFGVTSAGGSTGCGGGGCGTVFKVDPKSGKESVVHGFKGGMDGAYAVGLVAVENGVLYGTTSAGGGPGCGGGGCGTMFTTDTSGRHHRVLYRFLGGYDGATPENGLTYVGGSLYGTTWSGGGSSCGGAGCGTVFKLIP
jgi:uncharacterized repeat protein (TIGR03803 family)